MYGQIAGLDMFKSAVVPKDINLLSPSYTEQPMNVIGYQSHNVQRRSARFETAQLQPAFSFSRFS